MQPAHSVDRGGALATMTVQSPSAAHMVVDGRSILNFSGSSYLGLSGPPEMPSAAMHAVQAYGSTCQLPRHYGFELGANVEVEAAARAFSDVEGELYFGTGYLFGQIALSALASDYDVAVQDECAHYNLHDGAAVAGKTVVRFRHLDADDLARMVEQVVREDKRPLVATDGMFPTYGVAAPLKRYRDILDDYGGWVLADTRPS